MRHLKKAIYTEAGSSFIRLDEFFKRLRNKIEMLVDDLAVINASGKPFSLL